VIHPSLQKIVWKENRDDLHTENTAPPACLMKLSPDFAIDVIPLHIACLFRASSEVIASLIRAYPEGVRHRNKWGMLPLHIVCSGVTGIPEIKSIATSDNLSHGFLKNLMKVRGDALSADRKDWDIAFIVSMLVSIFPESVYTECEHPQRMTPADCARDGLPEGPTKERVMRILNSHLANKNNCQHHAEPKDVSQADTKSKTKLSSFIMKQDWPSVNKRIFHHPEEASVWSLYKTIDPSIPHLPIHAACVMGAPGKVIVDLINAHPDGLKKVGKNDALPIHLACRNKPSLLVIQILLQSYPKCVTKRDAAGLLPIHAACIGVTHVEVIEQLLEAHPKSRNVKDYNGHTALTYIEGMPPTPERRSIEKMLTCPTANE